MITGTFRPEDLVAASWVHARPRRRLAVVGLVLLALFFLTLGNVFFGSRREPEWQDWLMLLLVPTVYISLHRRFPIKAMSEGGAEWETS